MPRPIDGEIRALLQAVRLRLDTQMAVDRFRVSRALQAVLADDATPETVEWAVDYLQLDSAPHRPPPGRIPLPEAADVPQVVREQVERSSAYQGQPNFTRQVSQTERRAEPGELCTCGRQAIVVYLGCAFRPTGDCGIRDGGDQTGLCPFCGGPRHGELEGRCPRYRLRLDADRPPNQHPGGGVHG
jgi:hypothetical protein